jgi:PAS domain S-box-containing protein
VKKQEHRAVRGSGEAERAGELAQARLAAIVESSDDAIVSKTLEGIITSWNGAAEKLFGYTAQEAIGQSIFMIVPPDRRDEEISILARLRQGERVEHFETLRSAKDGRQVPISLSISPIRDSTGTVLGVSKIARDITERRRVEIEREKLLVAERQAREEAQRLNRLKDEFLATLSHELRTPLNAILGWAHLLASRDLSPADIRRAGEVISRNARTQTQLIEDLLDMSRITSGKLRLDVQRVEPVSFIEAAIETVQPSADAKDIRIERMLDPLAGPLSGDPGRLQQVAWNLLSNAVKFTPRGGKVQVVLERVNSHIELTVSDTGQGIEPQFLPYLFERFSQADASAARQHGGLGLGLAIAKQLVELHGGSIRAKSAGAGMGASFTVHLPMLVLRTTDEDQRLHPRSRGSAALEADRVDLSGVKVLLVDDERDATELIKQVLEECGALVDTADSSSAAVALLEKSVPDVLISDIGMPEVDGYKFLRTLRASGPAPAARVPAIALTAFARSEDRTRAMRAGYAAHVAKPVEPAELIATVAMVARKTGW